MLLGGFSRGSLHIIRYEGRQSAAHHRTLIGVVIQNGGRVPLKEVVWKLVEKRTRHLERTRRCNELNCSVGLLLALIYVVFA